MAFEAGGALVNPGAKLKSPTITTPTFAIGQIGAPKLALLALSQLHTAPLAWQLPENAIISVAKLYVSTVATAAATLNIGYTATSAVTSADNLIDGVDVNAATGLFDNITDHGTDGLPEGQVGVKGAWVTVSEASGDATGMVGTLYLLYWPTSA